MSKLNADKLVRRGEWGEVWLVVLPNGACPSEEYLDTLPIQVQAQFEKRAEKLAAFGKITNGDDFHRLDSSGTPPIHEIKLHAGPGHRFYCWQLGNAWYVSHGGKKPKTVTKYTPEIERAQDIYNQRHSTS